MIIENSEDIEKFIKTQTKFQYFEIEKNKVRLNNLKL